MDPNGGKVKRLTDIKVDLLLSGLSPTEWSARLERLSTLVPQVAHLLGSNAPTSPLLSRGACLCLPQSGGADSRF